MTPLRRTTSAARAFTLIELLVSIAIISILAGLIMSAVVATRRSAWRTVCINNLRQLSHAMEMYRQDYGGYPAFAYTWFENGQPYHANWASVLATYGAQDERLFICPADPTKPSVPSQEAQKRIVNLSYSFLRCRYPPTDDPEMDARAAWRYQEAVKDDAVLECQHHGRRPLIAHGDGSVAQVDVWPAGAPPVEPAPVNDR